MALSFIVPLVAVVPALAVLLIDLARHEAHFRHEALFFGLVAGFVGGFLVVVAEALFLRGGPVFGLFVAPLLEMMMLIAIAGLPRYRHDPATVWYAGAAGLGMSALLLLGQTQSDAAAVGAGGNLARFAMAAVGVTLLHYAAGMVAGYGAAKDRLLPMLPLGYLLLLPGAIFLGELAQGGPRPFQGATLWAFLLLGYGALIGWYVGRQGHKLALPPDAARRARRAWRRRMRGE